MLAPIYRVYERRLLEHVRAFPVPRHIGLILDGNRRFGRLNGLRHPDDIYMAGANKLDDLLDWCIDLEIPAIAVESACVWSAVSSYCRRQRSQPCAQQKLQRKAILACI